LKLLASDYWLSARVQGYSPRWCSEYEVGVSFLELNTLAAMSKVPLPKAVGHPEGEVRSCQLYLGLDGPALDLASTVELRHLSNENHLRS
jgi:hypothetical protein